MPLGTEVGLGPCDIVLDGELAPLTGKGHSSPQFSAHLFALAQSPISATAEPLLHRVSLGTFGATCLNKTELVLPWAHQSPTPKRQIDQFSRFCTLCTASQWAPLSLKISPSHGGSGPHDPIQFMIPWASPSPQPKWHHHWFSRFFPR